MAPQVLVAPMQALYIHIAIAEPKSINRLLCLRRRKQNRWLEENKLISDVHKCAFCSTFGNILLKGLSDVSKDLKHKY